MDYNFLKPNSTSSSQTIPEESVTCIAMKEDRHQNIMSTIVLKKGFEEPWASKRVARLINSLGSKEITLKSDTEPAIIAFRDRVAENCRGHVGGCSQRGQAFERIGRECSDVVAWCHQNHQVPRGKLHSRRTPRRPNLAVVGVTGA